MAVLNSITYFNFMPLRTVVTQCGETLDKRLVYFLNFIDL